MLLSFCGKNRWNVGSAPGVSRKCGKEGFAGGCFRICGNGWGYGRFFGSVAGKGLTGYGTWKSVRRTEDRRVIDPENIKSARIKLASLRRTSSMFLKACSN